jgi:hypothetical protein
MRVTFSFILVSICSWALMEVASGESIPASVQACRSKVDDLQRLRCYDAAVDGSAEKSASMPLIGTTPPEHPSVESTKKAAAAPEPSPAAEEEAAKTATTTGRFTAKVTALGFRRSGAANVTLDNGQIWTQYGPEGRVPLRAGDSVTLRPGLFGASVLVGPSGWTTKVHLISSQGSDPHAN